jgi:hypothetical protein
VNAQPSRINVSLLSHTNAGKTTIARTLLRQDIGEVADRPHVTEIAESHVLIESATGDALVLWDTPGFGDSARLLRRLKNAGNPFGWFLTQVWDRFTDRPFWCSQQAMRTAKDSSDVVLYVANAGEDPAAAGYVDAELEILGWIGKPILVLLNQLGSARSEEALRSDVLRWETHVANRPSLCGVLPFDAFARCWVQEGTLLERVQRCLPESHRPALGRLREAWRRRNLEVFEKSMQVIADQLAAVASDSERLTERGMQEKARAWVAQAVAGADRPDASLGQAQQSLASRLDGQVRDATAALVRLHGLTGKATNEVLKRMGSEFTVERPADADKAGVIGGLVSGALGGLAADIAAGGFTFGAGMLIGGVLGAFGARELTRAYNLSQGSESGVVRWSPDFLTERMGAALVRYLVVAHFGRGRGEFVAGIAPEHWRTAVAEALGRHRAALAELWNTARGGMPAERLSPQLLAIATDSAKDTLARLYPHSASVFNDGLLEDSR